MFGQMNSTHVLTLVKCSLEENRFKSVEIHAVCDAVGGIRIAWHFPPDLLLAALSISLLNLEQDWGNASVPYKLGHNQDWSHGLTTSDPATDHQSELALVAEAVVCLQVWLLATEKNGF